MTAREIDNPPAAKLSPHATRHLPRLIQLLPRETPGAAHRPGDGVKQRRVGKAIAIADGQAGFREWREHDPTVTGTPRTTELLHLRPPGR